MTLVTGCAGFIGSNFMHMWLGETGEPIVNLDKLTYAGNPANLEALASDPRHVFVHGDIGDAGLVDRLPAEHAPRAMVNLAAESHVDRSIHGPSDFINTKLGTFNLLENVRGYRAALPDDRKRAFRFLHVSTDEVYGSLQPTDPPFAATNRYEPNSPYSTSKAVSDHLVRAWHHTHGMPVLTTNCSNNYSSEKPTRKVERELEWRPRETFQSGIRRTIRRYLDNPAWVKGVATGSCRQWVSKHYGG